MSQCLTNNDLATLLSDDSKSNPEIEILVGHLDTCADCVTRLEKLSVSMFPEVSRDDVRGSDATQVNFTKKLEPVRRHIDNFRDGPQLGDEFEQHEFGEGIRTIGSYRLLEEIGAGGMGRVYRAFDEKLNRIVAVKILAERFGVTAKSLISHEALAAAQVEHANVIPVFSIETIDDETILVTQLLDGGNLADRIVSGECSRRDFVTAIVNVAQGLHEAHEQGVIHRDVKPANVFFEKATGIGKIGDFGLAIAQGNRDSKLSGGTPGYLSPELKAGSLPNRRSDIYALGITLYQALLGSLTFEFNEGSHLSADLNAIVSMATNCDPESRYATMEEFAEDLQNWLDGEPVLAREQLWRDKLKRLLKKHKVQWAAAAIIGIVGCASWWLYSVQAKKIDRMSASTGMAIKKGVERLTTTSRLSSPASTYKEHQSNLNELLAERAEQKAAKLTEASDLGKVIDTQLRSGNDFYRSHRHLRALSCFEAAVDAAKSFGVEQLEPMKAFRLLRGCRFAIELNLNNRRVKQAKDRIADFRFLAERLEFASDEFVNRVLLQGMFVDILESKWLARNGESGAAIEYLSSMMAEMQRLSDFDFKKTFRSNRHRIEVNSKWSAAMYETGKEKLATDHLLNAAAKYPVTATDDWFSQGRSEFTAWDKATEQFVNAKQYELAEVSNNKVIDLLNRWPAPEKYSRIVAEELLEAQGLAETLGDLVD